MPPKRMDLDDSDDDDLDFILPLEANKPRAKATTPASQQPARTLSSSGDGSYASQLLAARKQMAAQRGTEAHGGSASARSRSPEKLRTPASIAASDTRDSAVVHAFQTKTPVVASPTIPAPPHEATAAFEPVPSQPPPPPQKDPAVLMQEKVNTLRAQLETKKNELAKAKATETELREHTAKVKADGQAKLASLESQIQRLWQEAEDERIAVMNKITEADEEQEKMLIKERERIAEAAAREAEPQLSALRQQLAEARERKALLSNGITMAATNKDLVNSAIAAAITSVMDNIKTDFEKNVISDGNWDAALHGMIRDEIQRSFVRALHVDEEEERKTMAKAFDEMLHSWHEAEDEERAQVLRMDEQLLADVGSFAGDDRDRMHREEMAMQEAYLHSREAWAQHYREALASDLEAAIRRRTTEFEELRAQRHALHEMRMKAVEEQHQASVEREKYVHEKELDSIRSSFAHRQQLDEERQRMLIEMRERSSQFVDSLKNVAVAMDRLLDDVSGYKAKLDATKSEADAEQIRVLTQQENALGEVQQLIVTQATAVESERRALSSTVVKLEVVHAALHKQIDEEKYWVSQVLAKLERSRLDWDREYRRWQHLSAQERLQVEQRLSSVINDLRSAAFALEEESHSLDTETANLKRRCAEREAKAGADIVELEQRQNEVNERYNAMTQLVSELEMKSAQMSQEWQQLYEQRQQLAAQRQDLKQDELRMEQLSEQLRTMRTAIDTTHAESLTMAERAKALQDQIRSSRATVDAENVALREHSQRLGEQRARLVGEQTRVNELAASQFRHSRAVTDAIRHAAPPNVGARERLPQKLLAELQGILRAESAPQQQQNPQNVTGQSTHQDRSSFHFTKLVDVDTTSASS